jgi:hypothetical protein
MLCGVNASAAAVAPLLQIRSRISEYHAPAGSSLGPPIESVMSIGVVSWWHFLCAVAVFNIVAWALAARALNRRRTMLSAEAYAACRLQLLLSSGYVFGCTFRSVLPVYDVPRLCLFDTWLSSVIVGRSVATVAELCFAGQWALMLRESARATGSAVARIVSPAVLSLIGIAEVCSWYAVLTTWNLGHVAENSIWGVSAMLVVASVVVVLPRCSATERPILIAWCAAGIGFVAFIFLVDVPMYWARWIADTASGHHYLSAAQGLMDVATRSAVSYRWEDWRSEMPWMSLYFSAGVWVSISLINAPAPGTRAVDSFAGADYEPT